MLNYFNWEANQPNSPSQTCIVKNSSKWMDRSCTEKFPFVCQVSKYTRISTTQTGHHSTLTSCKEQYGINIAKERWTEREGGRGEGREADTHTYWQAGIRAYRQSDIQRPTRRDRYVQTYILMWRISLSSSKYMCFS